MNGHVALEGELTTNGICSLLCELPAGVMKRDQINLLEILHRDGVAPCTVGESKDQRILSLRFVRVAIYSMDPANEERPLTISRPLFLVTGLALPGEPPGYQLAKFLYGDDCDIVLWIDFKDANDFGIWKAAAARDIPSAHIRLAPKAVWGGPTIVTSILEGIAYAVAKIPDWTRLVVCSNRDVPILTRTELLAKISSLNAYDFVGSRWNNSAEAILPAMDSIPTVETIFELASYRTYTVRREMSFKVEEPLAELYPEKAIRNLTIATTMPNRYRTAISESIEKNTLILSRPTRSRALERDKFLRSLGLIAGRQWILTGRKFAEIIVSVQSIQLFNEGFRDVLIADECFFQSMASFYQKKGEIEALWTSIYFEDAKVFHIDGVVFKAMLAKRSGLEMFGRKAAGHLAFEEFLG